MASRCRRGTITFKTRRGRVIHFTGRHGADCGPRAKPSTRHLAPYKKALATAARSCKRKGGGVKAFRRCVGQQVRAATR